MSFVQEKARAILESNPGLGLEDLCEQVANDFKGRELRPALREALPDHLTPIFSSGGQSGADTQEDSAPARSSHSARWTNGIPWNDIPQGLRQSYRGKDQRKPLGVFTLDDAEYAGTTRRNQAKANEAKADSFDYVATQLRQHQAARVIDLPDEVRREIEEMFS